MQGNISHVTWPEGGFLLKRLEVINVTGGRLLALPTAHTSLAVDALELSPLKQLLSFMVQP